MSDAARRVYRPPTDAAERIRRLVGLFGQALPPLCWCTGFDPINENTVNELIMLVDSWREPPPTVMTPCPNCQISETTMTGAGPTCTGCGGLRT